MNYLFKKISIVAAALILSFVFMADIASADDWVHSPEPFDYKNGLFDDDNFLKMISHNIPEKIINNIIEPNVESNVGNSKYEILSGKPFDLTGIYVAGGGRIQRVFFRATLSDGQVITYTTGQGGTYKKFNAKDIISMEIQMGETGGQTYFSEFEIFGSYQKEDFPPVEVISVRENINSIDVFFKKPDEAQAVDVWLDGQKIERTTKENYTYENLKPDTEYELMFVNYYGDDNYGSAVRKTARTKKEEVGEVKGLTAKAESYNQVNLNWDNPTQSNFFSVIIYRDEIADSKGFFNLFKSAFAADPTKIFETNGTYFIDHSVTGETKYEYLVTTMDDEGKESNGVKQVVSTPKKPKPKPPDSSISKDDNGDYLVSWTSPVEGKVLIRIDGKDYVTVDAVNGSYLIPGADMVYSLLGNPLVEVIAIDSDGDQSGGVKPGKPPGGGNGGIGGIGDAGGIKVSDVVEGTFSLIWILAPFILLGLIIILVPRIIRLIRKSNSKK